jgi:antitoxin MazE
VTVPVDHGRTKVLRWGNGLGVRIPLSLARRIGIGEGTTVNLVRDGRRVLITPLTELPTLDHLLAGVTCGTVPAETKWRGPGEPR